jgi:hypothetical protein
MLYAVIFIKLVWKYGGIAVENLFFFGSKEIRT